jgi:hypothetical protein
MMRFKVRAGSRADNDSRATNRALHNRLFAGNNGALSGRKWLGGGSSPPEGSAKAAQLAFLSR